jgi:FlaA1/EpsC-like NDP-sugar epimerase
VGLWEWSCAVKFYISPQKLIIIDRYEAYLTELMSRLLSMFPADHVVPLLCPLAGNEKIASVFLEYQPHIVLHTTMRKYPPLFDIQVENVFRVNWLATFEYAKQAVKSGCEYFVMISSVEAEKHGNPVSDSLRAAEISLHHFFASQGTMLVTVRLCDILETAAVCWPCSGPDCQSRTGDAPISRYQTPLPFQAYCCALYSQSLALAAKNPTEDGIFVCNNGASISLMDIASKLAMLRGELESDLRSSS